MSDPFIERLDATGLEYEIIPCDPDLADTAAFCEAYGYALEDSANTIVVMGKADPPVFAACGADSRYDHPDRPLWGPRVR